MDTVPPTSPPPSNIPEYTVSEISGAVKRTLEGAFNRIRVRGEVTDFKRYPSGHIYFSLKDEGGKISGVIWKGSVSKLGLLPENGVEVIATGRVSAYGDRSAYQLVVERMEYAGAGALLARIERLRAALAAEGLFDQARKRPIPLLPAVIGVVTSASGAVLHDIRTTIARRFPRPLLIWPVPVQGDGAADRIAAAIAGFDRIAHGGPIPRPDILIIARGGGSLEDLMAFNDEAVIRAAAACRIPLISAVGHETDHTLIDLVSDRRAPTPTAAAEMAVPSRTKLVANLAQETARLVNALARLTRERRLRLRNAAQALPNLPGIADAARQRLDDRAQRLLLALPNLLASRRAALARAHASMPDLPGILATARQRLDAQRHRLTIALPNLAARRRAALAEIRLPPPKTLLAPPAASLRLAAAALLHAQQRAVAARHQAQTRIATRLQPAPLHSALREARTRLHAAAARLESVSPNAVLARGYAMVIDAGGAAVTRSAGLRPGASLALRFVDGDTPVTVDGRANPRQTRLPL